MHETHFPESKALVSAAYDDETRELTIRLRTGRTYVYRDVEPWVYDGLVSADSAGRYYNLTIKDHFPYSEILAFGRPQNQPQRFGAVLPSRRPVDPSRGSRARRLQSRRVRRG